MYAAIKCDHENSNTPNTSVGSDVMHLIGILNYKTNFDVMSRPER
jgi:hypothetical protein